MSEPSTVCYAISSGSYSDYKINAVFSSKEKAEAKLNLFADGEIEEFPFDPEMAEAPAGMSPFACYNYKWDSAICEWVPCLQAFSIDYDSVVRAGNKVSAWVGAASITYVWAKDKDHAIKIAAERFTQHDAIADALPRPGPHGPQPRQRCRHRAALPDVPVVRAAGVEPAHAAVVLDLLEAQPGRQGGGC